MKPTDKQMLDYVINNFSNLATDLLKTYTVHDYYDDGNCTYESYIIKYDTDQEFKTKLIESIQRGIKDEAIRQRKEDKKRINKTKKTKSKTN
jgi:hypothetical protein